MLAPPALAALLVRAAGVDGVGAGRVGAGLAVGFGVGRVAGGVADELLDVVAVGVATDEPGTPVGEAAVDRGTDAADRCDEPPVHAVSATSSASAPAPAPISP
jgi:hypothetical protein